MARGLAPRYQGRMVRPWTMIDRVDTAEGPLELRQRAERDFMITVGGRVLMTSERTRSEIAVAELGCLPISQRPKPRVLIGGLGLGYTLRAALDSLPQHAEVVMAELNAPVVTWCTGPLAVLTDNALGDPRVQVRVEDVTRTIREAATTSRKFDSIILDLYEGPGHVPPGKADPLYGRATLRAVNDALTPGGIYAVWGEKRAPAFERDLRSLGFTCRLIQNHAGQRHPVYVAQKGEEASPRSAPKR
jgi:spermidine synthase